LTFGGDRLQWLLSSYKVCYWCVHGDPDNLESLKDKRMKGNHQKATEKYAYALGNLGKLYEVTQQYSSAEKYTRQALNLV
jgi:hypothetical protein